VRNPSNGLGYRAIERAVIEQAVIEQAVIEHAVIEHAVIEQREGAVRCWPW